MSLFSTLGLDDSTLRMLVEEGYTTPTEIQAQAIPPALAGKDVLGIAQTGTGKTAAFALPIIQKLQNEKLAKKMFEPRALILSPTRELAAQIAESFATYGRGTGLRHTVVFGGVSQYHQERALERGVDILVATPGRLIDLIDQGIISLSSIHTFVLDEADRMLDMGFIDPIREIAKKLAPKRQTLLFSATMPPEIAGLAASLLHNPVRVAVHTIASAAPKIEQLVYAVPRDRKFQLLGHILKDPEAKKVLVFIKTKHNSDKVTKRLRACGERAETIHGNKPQSQRTRALDGFRSGRARVLVATDVAARGLDVDDITHVINYDLPIDAEAYVHRIGRTARAGATGIAIAFCDDSERNLLRSVERLIKKPIPRGKLPAELPDMKPAPGAMVEDVSDRGGERGGRRERGGRGDRGATRDGGRRRIRGESRDAGPRESHAKSEHPKAARPKAELPPEEPLIREDLPEDVSVRRDYPRTPRAEHKVEHKTEHKSTDKKSFAERAFEKKTFEKKPFEKKPFEKKTFGEKKDFGKKMYSPRKPHPLEARVEVESDRGDEGGGHVHHGDSRERPNGFQGGSQARTQGGAHGGSREGGHVGFGKRGGFKQGKARGFGGASSGGGFRGGASSGGDSRSGAPAGGGFKSGGFKSGSSSGGGFKSGGFKSGGFKKAGFKKPGFKKSGGFKSGGR